MTFNNTEHDFISFGKIIMLSTMNSMKKDGDDLNQVQFDYLLDKELRNINDKDFYEFVCDVLKAETDEGHIKTNYEE